MNISSPQIHSTKIPSPSTTNTSQPPANPLGRYFSILPIKPTKTLAQTPSRVLSAMRTIARYRSQTSEWPAEYPRPQVSGYQAEKDHYSVLFGLSPPTPRPNLYPVLTEQDSFKTDAGTTLPFDVFKTEADRVVEQVLFVNDGRFIPPDTVVYLCHDKALKERLQRAEKHPVQL